MTDVFQAHLAEDLPVSLAELMNIRPELAEALPRGPSNCQSPSLSCGESEQVVLQHFLAALNATLADEMEPNLNKVLKLESSMVMVTLKIEETMVDKWPDMVHTKP